ncbi:hypothetical protein CBR_g25914 [Chara braunii]|uniref:Ubiquitin-like protease family profile domain-containing protein n=1 Tax=Chara braunii TaxID=69332 RepID=A0A388L6N7_CHABU|nr:hypothetical protein CBR_g25914 [Chara braunii]|eukprot:GBG77981.1 hypothetical protein CBR_g25914 [Chara braunii]
MMAYYVVPIIKRSLVDPSTAYDTQVSDSKCREGLILHDIARLKEYALIVFGGGRPSVHVPDNDENLVPHRRQFYRPQCTTAVDPGRGSHRSLATGLMEGTGQGVEGRDSLRTSRCRRTQADVPWRSFVEDQDGAAQLGVNDEDGAAQRSCHQAGLNAGNGTVNRAVHLCGSFLAAACSSVSGVTFRLMVPMSTSRREEQPTGTSGRESTTKKSWSDHMCAKSYVDWCCGDENDPTRAPCGPVLFVEDSRRRRVLGSVEGWQAARSHDKMYFKLHAVYNSKGGIVAASKGVALSWDLFQGFGAGALRTPFYTELAAKGLVSAMEFFNLLEKRDVHLDEPCQISCDLALSQPVQMCTGFESKGVPSEGGDLGSGASFQLHRGEERGHFDDSEGEEEERTSGSPVRGGDCRVLSIPGVEIRTPVQERPSTSAGGHTMGSGGRPAGVLSGGEEGEQQSSQKRRGDSRGDSAAASKKQKTKAPQTSGGKRKGGEGHVGAASHKRPSSAQIQPLSVLVQQTGPIDVDAAYFLEWKDGVRTKREIPVNPSQVVDIGEWEAGYNQRSLDPVHTQLIIDSMTTAYSQASKTYELPTLKLAPLGLEKPKPWVRAQRLKPEDWKDELAGQYYYYAVAGQHNEAAARTLLGTDVALRYNFERWPARMVYFSDADFEGYFLVSAEDNKKYLKAPPRQSKLLMKDIRWCWKDKGYPRATGSSALAKQGKLGMQEAVHLVKCDLILVRLWNYYQFKYENRSDSDWTRSYPFLRKREAILAQFKSQGLDAALWDGSRKLVGDSSFFRDYPPFMGCEDDKSIKATEKLVVNKKLSIDWKNKVLSMLTDSRSKSMDVALTEGMVHIRLEAGDAAAVGAHVKVTPTDVSEMSFEPCEWPLVIPGRDRKVYKDMERNPAQLAHLLEFVCKKGEGVMFLGKAHAQVVWEALKGGRNVIALEGNSELLQYTLDFLKGAVNSGDHRCEFISRTDKPRRAWESSTDMCFKLSERKRDRIYEFLFLETRPRRDSDPEYIRRKEHMLVLLDNYHGASRLNAKNFLDRLECLYFVESEQELRVASYSALIDTDEQATTGVVFDGSKSAKFADIRTSQNVEPPPLDVAKSVGVRAASTTHWSAIPSTTEFAASVGTGRGSSAGVPITGVKYKFAAIRTKPPEVHHGEPVLRSATGAEVSETGAKMKSAGIRTSVSSGATSDDFPTRQGTASAVRDGQPAEFNARLDSGAPSVLCNLNSAGIRTCWGTDLQSEVVGRAEDEMCAGAEDLSTGVDAGPVGGADMRERDGGEEWVQVEDNQEEFEWKEGGGGGRTNDQRVEKMLAALSRLTRSDTCTRCNVEVMSTTKRRRWKWRLRARGALGGIFDNTIAPRVLTVMGDISQGLVPPHHVLSTFDEGQVRITAKDLLTVLLVDGKLNDEVVNFYMALLGSTACMTRQTSSGLRVFSFSFSSFFFSKLQLHGHGGVERRAKNVDLLHFDMIFVPVHKDNDHWILLSINLRDNVFEILDSCPRVIADSRFYLSVFEFDCTVLRTSYLTWPLAEELGVYGGERCCGRSSETS